MSRRRLIRTPVAALAAGILVLIGAACTESSDRLDTIDDERSPIEVGDDQAAPEVGDDQSTPETDDDDSVGLETDAGETTAPAPTTVPPTDDTLERTEDTAPSPDDAAPSPDDDAGAAPPVPSGDPAGLADPAGPGPTAGGPGAGQDPPEADEAIEDADRPPDADPATADRFGIAYPDTPVVDLASGSELELVSQLADRDKRTLLWFWAPGDGPSAAEAATVAELAVERADKVDVIAVGTGGDRDEAEAFLADTGLTATSVLWDGGADAVEHYAIDEIPTAVLLDRDGAIIARWSTLSPEVFSFLDILP